MITVTAGDALHLYGSVGRGSYSVRLCIREDIYYRALLKELEDNGIPYTERPAIINDIAGFDEP